MSDLARESFTDKAAAAVIPDSQQSNSTVASNTVKGKADEVAGSLPGGTKSDSQKAGDTLTGTGAGNKGPIAALTDAIGLTDSKPKH
ncbi:hypothetical protein BDV93DRAFT_551703 [Ceratobasidium sp. AG-I]|nr:hypothetical protein BDV93DRAFT_551703 [Ceratobasidium sp. AG-I]